MIERSGVWRYEVTVASQDSCDIRVTAVEQSKTYLTQMRIEVDPIRHLQRIGQAYTHIFGGVSRGPWQ